MQSRQTDVAIIGGGTAGMAAYREARANGRRAILIEGGSFGTTCARVACMPSKLLIAAANAAFDTRHLGEFGIRLDGPVHVDGVAVLARVRRERDRFVDSVLAEIADFPEADKLRGQARFINQTTLEVQSDGQAPLTVLARTVIIATGAHAVIPPEYAALGELAVTSDQLFEWPTLPRRVAVIGTGLIALELGQALSRLGVAVHMFGRGGAVGPLTDPAVSDYARKTFQEEFYFDADARIDRVTRVDQQAELRFVDLHGISRSERFDYVLVATGRRPNLASLDLAKTGLALDDHGVPRFDPQTQQCGNSAIFIAGDADNQRPWLNDAADDGRIAGNQASVYPAVSTSMRRAPMSVVFSSPQMLMVGERYAALAAHAQQRPFVVGQASFDDQGRAKIEMTNRGLVRLYAETSSGLLLGAEGFAAAGEHFAHLLGWALQCGMTVQQMTELPFYHPVYEEGLRSALRDATTKLPRSLVANGPRIANTVGM
ncbi:MAG: dihydrolipoyl dehydrogenase [Janthinobacterium lividum]